MLGQWLPCPSLGSWCSIQDGALSSMSMVRDLNAWLWVAPGLSEARCHPAPISLLPTPRQLRDLLVPILVTGLL